MSERDDDVRVGHVLRGEVEAEELPADVQAQLAQWFGGESLVEPHLADESAPPPEFDESDEQLTRHQQWQRASFDIDPVLHAHLEQREIAADAHIAALPVQHVSAEGPMSMTGSERWEFPEAEGPREVERPWDLDDDLTEVTPQAVLRDLHRPVTHFELAMEPLPLGTGVGLGLRALSSNRRVMHAEYRVDIRDFPSSQTAMDEDLGDLRARLDVPWDQLQLQDTDTPELSPSELMALQAKWFR